jgi:hypothetical protein
VVAVIWLIVCIAAVAVGGYVVWWWGNSRPDEGDYQAMVELHRIRRRFDVSQFKSEVRRDAADARRELRDELSEMDRRGRQP